MCCVFWLNIAAAFIQIVTAIVMVGWIMSIFWGMDMVILASEYASVIPKQGYFILHLFKGIVLPKILSLITRPHVIPNL
ncbi:hypothetical protein PO909_010334 [Leuciscus waleckii]